MTSTYAIMIDWREEFTQHPEKWTNHGRDILVDSCNHKNGARYEGWCEKCDISEDDCQPMMNYMYPLEIEPSNEAILKVVKNTALTVLGNEDTGDFCLALCGGGMDFSQSIGLAYS